MASGWNLWVWLECIGVVSECCCKEVYRYPHNNYYFSLLHLYYLFFGSIIPISLFIKKKEFFHLYIRIERWILTVECAVASHQPSRDHFP